MGRRALAWDMEKKRKGKKKEKGSTSQKGGGLGVWKSELSGAWLG